MPFTKFKVMVKDNYYLLTCDQEILNKETRDKLQDRKNDAYKINFKSIPQPFWGNVTNPKIIILYKNPNIEMNGIDETYKQALIENCHLGNFDFFEKENQEFKWENNRDFSYWQKHYPFMRDNKDKEDQVSQLIGEFEYFPYNSSLYKHHTQKEYKGHLPSQKIVFEHISSLLKDKPLVIIARGVSLWLEAVEELKDYENLMVLSSPSSGYISKNNLKFMDYKNIQAFDLLENTINNSIKGDCHESN